MDLINPITLQWIIVITFGLGLLWLSPRARTVDQFFKAATQNRQPGMLLLTSSLVISWIFAKSITNAANLGMSYGLLGGLAYAGYYLSFLVCGLVLFNLRVKGKFQSIHQFLEQKFGRKALVLFSVLIAIRLFNEVWSNTMVIGSYFGESGSWPYYGAVLAFTGLTLAYAIKGGLRSSLFTDAIQMVLFGVILSISGLHPKANRRNLLLGGILAGFMGTTSSMPGPALALIHQHVSPARMRGALAPFFVLGGLVSLVGLVWTGQMERDGMVMGLGLVLPALLGLGISSWTAPHVKQSVVRPAVLLFASLAASGLLYRSI